MAETRAAAPVVEVVGLTKRFGAVTAVEGLGFTVQRGTTCALLGGNGAGKTTTLSMLLGLLLPTSGRIRILGRDMLHNRYAVLARMNFSSPYVDLPQRLTVYQNLNVYAHLYGIDHARARITELAQRLDLEGLLHNRYGTLSAGQRTRVGLAKSLLNRPEVLLLDEPTASLDPDTADRVRGYLEQYRADTGATLLLASHNMAEVERMCDAVIILRAGRIVDRGRPSALIQRYGRHTLEEVFLDIARSDGSGAGSAGS
ncbi:MAG: ABC transporter ATP-binding protein [Gammaproteobacteria bacterium]